MGQAQKKTQSFHDLIGECVMHRFEVEAYMASLVFDDAPKRTPERANSRPRMLRLVSGEVFHHDARDCGA